MYVRVFLCCALLCKKRGLVMDRSPIQGVLQKCVNLTRVWKLILNRNRPEGLISEMNTDNNSNIFPKSLLKSKGLTSLVLDDHNMHPSHLQHYTSHFLGIFTFCSPLLCNGFLRMSWAQVTNNTSCPSQDNSANEMAATDWTTGFRFPTGTGTLLSPRKTRHWNSP